jgi:hypothetical protein
MINCSINSLCAVVGKLAYYEVYIIGLTYQLGGPDELRLVGNALDLDEVKKWVGLAKKVAVEFEMQSVLDRIEKFEEKSDNLKYLSVLRSEISVLKEAFEAETKRQFVLRIPKEKTPILLDWKKHWAEVLVKFDSSKVDIFHAKQCWCYGQYTACVFHLMRVLEHGLSSLAVDVGKTFDVQNWQNIIDQIEAEIRSLGKTLPTGSEKSDRIQFLSEAAKEFMYFKDGWRNYVMHKRAIYDEHQARSVMEHTRSFMITLSSRLGEVHPSP